MGETTKLVILNRPDFEDNYHQLRGESLAVLNVIWNSTNTALVADSFLWLMESFRQHTNQLGETNHNLLFSFMGMFARTQMSMNKLRNKILFSLREHDCDPSIIEWMQSNGQDGCMAKGEDEWITIIKAIVDTDSRSLEQVNSLLEQGHSSDSDRIALRVKIVLDGHKGGDALTMIIRRVMGRNGFI